MSQGYGTLQEGRSGSWPSLSITSSSDDEDTRSSSRFSPPPGMLSNYNSAQDPSCDGDDSTTVGQRPCYSSDSLHDCENNVHSQMAECNASYEQYAKFLMFRERYQRLAPKVQNFEQFLEMEYTLNEENSTTKTYGGDGNEGVIRLGWSSLFWLISYMFMGLCGGSVAFYHMPRYYESYPMDLPDFGYDLIPYFCPVIDLPLISDHDNVQSLVLVILYFYIVGNCIARENGRIIFQRLLHLNSLIFVTRTTTVGVTGFPNPNPRCVSRQHDKVSFVEAVQFVMGRGFPPHACGDLMYSGHVACILSTMIIGYYHDLFHFPKASRAVNTAIPLLANLWAFIGVYSTIACRSHYTVDVVVAFYMTPGLFGFYLYLLKHSGVAVGGKLNWVQWLEGLDLQDSPVVNQQKFTSQ